MRWVFCFLLVFTSCGTPYGKHDHEECLFGRHIATQYGLKLISLDNLTTSSCVKYALAFTSERSLSLQEAQLLAQHIVNDILARKNAPLSGEIGLKISFWDKEMNRIRPPAIAEIVFADSTFSYYQRDPESQAIRLVLKEQF